MPFPNLRYFFENMNNRGSHDARQRTKSQHLSEADASQLNLTN